jgi:hypothetical protein
MFDPNKVRIDIVTSLSRLNDYRSIIEDASLLVLDCETTGLNQFDKAVGIG